MNRRDLMTFQIAWHIVNKIQYVPFTPLSYDFYASLLNPL